MEYENIASEFIKYQIKNTFREKYSALNYYPINVDNNDAFKRFFLSSFFFCFCIAGESGSSYETDQSVLVASRMCNVTKGRILQIGTSLCSKPDNSQYKLQINAVFGCVS